MKLTHFYHGHHLHEFAKHPNLRFFELAIWLHTLATSLISVFIPILLLKIGYPISSILIYYLIYNTLDVPLNFVVGSLVRKIGARKVLILGTLFTIAFFGLLGVLPPGNWPLLILLGVLAAICDTLFWASHIYIFIESNRGGLDTGKTAGSLEAVRKLANTAGPLLGAFMLITIGKTSLIIESILIFALSIIPLFKMRHMRDIPSGKKVSFREFFRDPNEKKNYLSLALWGVHSETDQILWPLFIFTIFGTIESVAAISIIVSLSTAAFAYFAGKLTQKYGHKMIALGSFLIACAWISRIIFQNSYFYYMTIFLVGFFALLVIIPIDGNIITRGLKLGSIEASTYRNAAVMALRVPLYLILIVLVEVFKVSFGIASFSLIILLLITSFLSPKIKDTNISASATHFQKTSTQ